MLGVKVQLATADQTALANQDYVPVAKTFTFKANAVQLSQHVDVHGFEDGVQETVKQFQVNLTNAIGGATIMTPHMVLKVSGVEPLSSPPPTSAAAAPRSRLGAAARPGRMARGRADPTSSQ